MRAGGIMALDLGTLLGHCYGMPGGGLVYGSYRLPADRGDGAFFSRFRQWLLDQLTIHDPRLLVYEAPLITGNKTHFQTAFRLMGLCAHAEEIGHLREIRTERANNQTIKRFLTGSGRAEKIDMLENCRQRGYDPPDHNSADAIGLFLYAESKHAPQVKRAAGPLFDQVAG